jgi:GntR family transcriptional repressor for pyruvate dehydrogenase complex
MAHEIVRRISTMIFENDLAPGSQLPSERDLAARFSVSRPTLREAVHVLEALKLVEVRPGGGTYIARKPTVLSPRLLEHMLENDDRLVVELIETRREFEGRNAELAAQNATSKDLQRLGGCLKVMVEDVEAGHDDFRHDIDFHLCIAEATHNRVRLFITTTMLLAHFEMLRDARQRMVRRHRQLVGDFLREHEAICGAIREKDPVKARDAMNAHIEAAYGRNQIATYLRQMKEAT